MFQKISDQSVSYSGIFSHTWCWVTSNAGDYIYHNPHFKQSDTEECIDIYCIHGTADRPQSFSKIVERLLSKGLHGNIRSIILVAFEGRFQGYGIDYFAQQVMEKIASNKSKRVQFMGHSRGALVAAYADYLASFLNIQVDTVFALAGPFKGSWLAMAPFTWVSTSVQQMAPENEFLQTVAEWVMRSPARYFFFEAFCDAIVTSGQAYIDKYVEKYPCSLIKVKTQHGHLSLMSSHKLVNKLHVLINTPVEDFQQIAKFLCDDESDMTGTLSDSETDVEECDNEGNPSSLFDF